MSDTERIAQAAAPWPALLRAITPDQLTAPTPCADFDVRGLIDHLLFWGPSLIGAARKEMVAPPDGGPGGDRTDGIAALQAHLDALIDAWSDPAAWRGVTVMGGPMELPAPLVGGMVAGELIVHGWDLARAVDVTVDWNQDLLAYAHAETTATAQQGREMGIYGPEVAVDPAAPLLDRLLALTGRDPAWTASPLVGDVS